MEMPKEDNSKTPNVQDKTEQKERETPSTSKDDNKKLTVPTNDNLPYKDSFTLMHNHWKKLIEKRENKKIQMMLLKEENKLITSQIAAKQEKNEILQINIEKTNTEKTQIKFELIHYQQQLTEATDINKQLEEYIDIFLTNKLKSYEQKCNAVINADFKENRKIENYIKEKTVEFINLKKEFLAIQKLLDTLNQNRNDILNKNNKLKEKIQSSLERRSQLENELLETKENINKSNINEDLVKQRKSLLEKKDILENILNRKEAVVAEKSKCVDEFDEKMKLLEQRIAILNERVKGENLKLSETIVKGDNLRKELDAKRQTLIESENNVAILQQKVAEKEEKLYQLREENIKKENALKEELKLAKENNELLKEKITSKDMKQQELKLKYSELLIKSDTLNQRKIELEKEEILDNCLQTKIQDLDQEIARQQSKIQIKNDLLTNIGQYQEIMDLNKKRDFELDSKAYLEEKLEYIHSEHERIKNAIKRSKENIEQLQKEKEKFSVDIPVRKYKFSQLHRVKEHLPAPNSILKKPNTVYPVSPKKVQFLNISSSESIISSSTVKGNGNEKALETNLSDFQKPQSAAEIPNRKRRFVLLD